MAFIITKDLINGVAYELNDRTAITGPQTLMKNTEDRLRSGEGDAFRLINDDDVPLFEGFYIEDSEAEEVGDDGDDLQPLEAYGRLVSDATEIQYRDFEGNWV